MSYSWFDYVMIGILWVCGIAVAGLVLFGIYIGIDTLGIKTRESVGTVTSRSFTPAHTYTTMLMVGKVMVPQVHYAPDTWTLEIQPKETNSTDTMDVTEHFYDKHPRGTKVGIKYGLGRLSHEARIKQVWGL